MTYVTKTNHPKQSKIVSKPKKRCDSSTYIALKIDSKEHLLSHTLLFPNS